MICDPIYVPWNYVPRTEKVKKSPDASCLTIFTMPLICDCQTKRDMAEWVCDVGKTLLMWLWLMRREIDGGRGFGCGRLGARKRDAEEQRRRAAFAYVMDELDNMVSDFDDKWNNNRIDCLCVLIIIIEIQPCRQYESHFLVRWPHLCVTCPWDNV